MSLPLHDYAGVSADELAFLRATFCGFATLEQLLDWGRDLEPPIGIADVIAQDEYSHDVLVPLPDRRWLAFDTT